MKHLFFLTLLFLVTFKGFAQHGHDEPIKPKGVDAEVILKDGNILRGSVIEEHDTSIIFRGELVGQISISRNKIADIRYFIGEKTGNREVYINLASRYFFSPSAINMKAGDGYYQNTYFFINSFNYAITNHFTIGGGFEIFSLLAGHPFAFITPKASFDINKNLHIGGGYLYANVLNTSGSFGGINTIYGNITVGNADHNLSVNAGTSLTYGGDPTLTICGFTRVSTKFGLMTENWLFPSFNGYYALYSFGGRIIGRKNLFDFGLITNPDITSAGIIGIPYLSYTLRF